MDDYLLDRRLRLVCDELEISLHIHSSDLFLSSHEMFLEHFHQKKHFFFHSFYIEQRRRLGILLDKGKEPVGGKWSYDTENRKKVPKGLCIPAHIKHRFSEETKESLEYVEKHFSHHVGRADTFRYPVTHEGAEKVLDHFLEHKLALFGDYEDAMMQDERILFHSQLSPLLNVGLLTPEHVITKTLEYAKEHRTPLNSLEGFIRQVIGWREFIRSVYLDSGVKQRKKNFFHHSRRMPSCFYEGTSGITPIDHCIHKLHEGAYLHHIERLMVLGNFFLLCEIDPHDIYRWFMEFFIDSYDWVMVPNVYGMSQFCDGGLMTTKPYFSSSSYILKMSDYGKGSWTEIWDSLFWRFMIKHEAFFKKQPRLNMLLSTAHKKKQDKAFLSLSNDFLDNMQDSTK
jgi:deoxyribodipyrimidine photolyase-related protein